MTHLSTVGPGRDLATLPLPLANPLQGSPAPLLLVKCLNLHSAADDTPGVLLASLADAATGRPPVTLELPVAR